MESNNSFMMKHIGKYDIIEQLGSGGFACVYLAEDRKAKQKVAIKVIDRKLAEEDGIILYIENELRLISRMSHPSIVKVYDIIYSPQYIMIVMEYLPSGDLQTLVDQKFRFGQSDQIRIAVEILEGLQYLHERGIAHRDIKPANIMFDVNMHAKIIDFGFSRENSHILSTCCGTQPLIAPEIVLGNQYDGKKADIWSFGITIYIMSCWELPFEWVSDAQFIQDIKANNLKYRIKVAGIIGWMVKNSLTYNPDERPSAADLLLKAQEKSNPLVPLSRTPVIARANTLSAVNRLKIVSPSPIVFRTRQANGPIIARPTTVVHTGRAITHAKM